MYVWGYLFAKTALRSGEGFRGLSCTISSKPQMTPLPLPPSPPPEKSLEIGLMVVSYKISFQDKDVHASSP